MKYFVSTQVRKGVKFDHSTFATECSKKSYTSRTIPPLFSMNRIPLVSLFILLVSVFSGCDSNDSSITYQPSFVADTSTENSLVMGFPSFSYSETGSPLVAYLNAHLTGEKKVIVKSAVDWKEYLNYLKQGKFDITIINGMLASEATRYGYAILGKITSDDPYSSFIITRKGSGITKVTDLIGKKVSMVPSNLIPATMMGMYFLHQHGVDVNLKITKESVASFEASIISVYLGKSDAGICARRSWNVYVKEHPEVLSKVEVKWETPPLEHNAVLIKNTVDRKDASQLMNILFAMHGKKDARKALDRLDISGFEKANYNTYKPMLEFKKKYDAIIF